MPEKWNECIVTPPHKGGHKSKKELSNYRRIALADSVGITFWGLLNERLKDVIETYEVMGEEHNGFRRDRREDNMFMVSEMFERLRWEEKEDCMAFLIIEKAYTIIERKE